MSAVLEESSVALRSPPVRSHLDWLEAEAIFILREVAGECANPVLFFSGGKDSIVLLRLAEKAFRPARFPFPLLHLVGAGPGAPDLLTLRAAEILKRADVVQPPGANRASRAKPQEPQRRRTRQASTPGC